MKNLVFILVLAFSLASCQKIKNCVAVEYSFENHASSSWVTLDDSQKNKKRLFVDAVDITLKIDVTELKASYDLVSSRSYSEPPRTVATLTYNGETFDVSNKSNLTEFINGVGFDLWQFDRDDIIVNTITLSNCK